jgi:hypothetical protein
VPSTLSDHYPLLADVGVPFRLARREVWSVFRVLSMKRTDLLLAATPHRGPVAVSELTIPVVRGGSHRAPWVRARSRRKPLTAPFETSPTALTAAWLSSLTELPKARAAVGVGFGDPGRTGWGEPVRLAPPLHAGLPQAAKPSASAVLGPGHPMARVQDALKAVVWRSLGVSCVLGASLIALAGGAVWAPAMAASVGLVLVVLGAVGGLLGQHRRDHVLALIAGGREELPVEAVERERSRLLDRRTRSRLASSFDSLVEEAVEPLVVSGPPMFDRAVVGGVADELRELAALLRDAPSSARGVAFAWCLLSDGVGSPLHRGDVTALREELGRIRHLLGAAGVAARAADRSVPSSRTSAGLRAQ